MAKNDMEVIMYKILRYLYECMKLGVEPELEQFAWNSKLFDIPQSYWCKIIATLVRKGLQDLWSLTKQKTRQCSKQTDHLRLRLRAYSSWKKTAACRKQKNIVLKHST